jgi:anti-sigma regulatory factor (Ser/Thr protein kinase)
VITPGSAQAGMRWPGGPPPSRSPAQAWTGPNGEPMPEAAEQANGIRGGGPAAHLALTDWPFQTHLELGALPNAVPCARLHTRQVLWEWKYEDLDLAESAELIVSELVTNGVRASAGLTGSGYAGRWTPGVPPLRLWLHGDRQRVGVQVWDGNDQVPIRQPTDPGAESGRGLLLVEALSSAWGSYRPQYSTGKVVWAVL